MATSCQSCDTLGVLLTAPAYPGCPPAPPATGCSAIWGQITGEVPNQEDLTTFIALNYYNRALIDEGFYTKAASDARFSVLPQTVVKAANQVSSSTSLTNDSELVLPLAANSRYRIDFAARTSHANGFTGTMNARFTVPAGTVGAGQWITVNDAGAIFTRLFAEDLLSTGVIRDCTSTSPPVPPLQILNSGIITTSGTAGNLTLQFATSNASMAVTLWAGSWLQIQKL